MVISFQKKARDICAEDDGDDGDEKKPLKGENIEEITFSTDKENIPGKDKIVMLPDNRMYFEFAVPKKKVILQVKPPAGTQEFKCQTLMELVNSLRMRNLIDSDAQELLEAFREFPKDLARVSTRPAKPFSEAVRKFASVLYFHSPEAYNLINTMFCLPDTDFLRSKLQTRNYWPGYTQEALELLKKSNPKEPVERVCSIMVDFIAIKKDCQYDTSHGRWIGYVDIGDGPTPVDSDEVPLASEIVLLTAVGIGRDWKLPFGYFLSNGMSGEALHSLISEAIVLLEGCGLNVVVIVCEGTPSTVKMAVAFGCNVRIKNYGEVVSSFPHPLRKYQRLHLMFGIHQSLSLLRNLLKDVSSLWSSTYGVSVYYKATIFFGSKILYEL